MRGLRTACGVIAVIGAVLAVALVIALAGVKVVGLETYPELSSRLEPEYPAGSLLYAKEADAAQLEPGDVIAFMDGPDQVSSGRIAQVVADSAEPSVLRFQLEGDGQSLVHYRNVLGKVQFGIPVLGFVAAFVCAPVGIFLCILLAVALILSQILLPRGGARKRGKFEWA